MTEVAGQLDYAIFVCLVLGGNETLLCVYFSGSQGHKGWGSKAFSYTRAIESKTAGAKVQGHS